MIFTVLISEKAQKQLKKVPQQVSDKLQTWVRAVKKEGLENIRKILGYHDEPLKGRRKEQRSIRLNKAYRAIYEIKVHSTIEFVSIEEVTKHEY